MCYWGLYKAESFYHSTLKGYAGKALDQAVALKDHVSEREQLYIEASAAAEGSGRAARQPRSPIRNCRSARKLVKKFPKDTAGADFPRQCGRREGSAVAIYESILKDNPEDSAANHYYIHDSKQTPS